MQKQTEFTQLSAVEYYETLAQYSCPPIDGTAWDDKKESNAAPIADVTAIGEEANNG